MDDLEILNSKKTSIDNSYVNNNSATFCGSNTSQLRLSFSCPNHKPKQKKFLTKCFGLWTRELFLKQLKVFQPRSRTPSRTTAVNSC